MEYWQNTHQMWLFSTGRTNEIEMVSCQWDTMKERGLSGSDKVRWPIMCTALSWQTGFLSNILKTLPGNGPPFAKELSQCLTSVIISLMSDGRESREPNPLCVPIKEHWRVIFMPDYQGRNGWSVMSLSCRMCQLDAESPNWSLLRI